MSDSPEPLVYTYTPDPWIRWQGAREQAASDLRAALTVLDDSEATPEAVAGACAVLARVAHDALELVEACRLAAAYQP